MINRTTKRTRWTVADARGLLSQWEVSGLSLRQFAEQQGVQVQRLQRWKQVLDNTPARGFVEVPLGHSRPTAPVEVILERGVVVRVSESTSIPLAVELLNALEQRRPC